MRWCVLAALVLAGCGKKAAPADMARPTDMAVGNGSVARGEYLVKHVALCGQCHTTPDIILQPSTNPADFLAGGRMFPVAGGAVYSRNLTPDVMTGIGSWSISQIKDAIRVGVDDQGLPLHPVMPYWAFSNLSDDDATSIALFLKSLPPRKHIVSQDTVQVAMAAPVVQDSMLPHTTLPATDASYASAERGRYLAVIACLDCHTRHDDAPSPPSAIDLARLFAGGHTFPGAGTRYVSANLTPDATGLTGWSATDVAQTIKTGLEKGTGRTLCVMPAGGDQLGQITDADLTDIGNFVHTLPPIADGPFGCSDGGIPYGVPDGG